MNNLSTVDLIVYTAACVGLCYILKYGSILNKVRTFLTRSSLIKELFACSLCLGFWSGAIVGLFTPYPVLVFALYSAIVCLISHELIEKHL